MPDMLHPKQLLKQLLPASLYRPVLRMIRRKPHCVRWGYFRRTAPMSRIFGFDRGTPICRYYIERFLARYQQDIQGHVLEIADADYTLRFGGSRVTRSDVLHVVPGNPQATIVGNLETGEGIPNTRFDCIILTQTLQFLYDVRAATVNLYAALKPGGVVLVTVSGISQISRYDMERWGDYWRFTDLSIRTLFQQHFPESEITLEIYGNVLAATAYLQGIAAEELTPQELDVQDFDYQVIIAVRARKPFQSHLNGEHAI